MTKGNIVGSENKHKVLTYTVEHLKHCLWDFSSKDGQDQDMHDIFIECFPLEDKDLILKELDPTLYMAWASALIHRLEWVDLHELLLVDLKSSHLKAIDGIK